MTYNYIVAYRSGRNYSPTSIFISGDILDSRYPVYNEWDAIDVVLQYCNPADKAVAAKRTILDYDAYMEDQYNLTIGLLNVLDEEG